MTPAPPVRCLLVGFPGSGKTGALACLLNAGFKLRVLDFDGNLEPLLLYADKDKLKNLSAVYLEDRMTITPSGFVEPVGIPQAFAEAFRLMDHWKFKDEEGNEVDLGPSREWGPDTILVLDGLTSMGEAAMRRARKIMNKGVANTTMQVQMLAQGEQAAFIDRLTSKRNRFHVIALAHLKMIAPKDIQRDDPDTTKELKERLIDMIPSRYYPRALGQELPQHVGGYFPTLLRVELEFKGHTPTRWIKTVSQEALDLKIPAPNFPARLSIEDGMLQVFRALSPGSFDTLNPSVSTEEIGK